MSNQQPHHRFGIRSRIAAVLGAAALLATSASTQAALVVNLDATTLPEGALPTWANAAGGDFVAGAIPPSVETVDGINGVTFNGTDHYYTGPSAIDLSYSAARTIEAWIFNPVMADEETIFSWGTRGGPNGSNCSFNHGLNGTFGAVGHWGTPDMGWDGNYAAGRWTYVAYTYANPIARVYFDGALANEEDVGALETWDYDTNNVEVPFRIASQTDDGGLPTTGLRGSMTIAKIRVHNAALSEQQINDAFAAEADAFGIGDTDGDGMPNWYENGYAFLNPNDASDADLDEDQDGLTNLAEYEALTEPDNPDTDGDGVSDGAEVNRMAGGVAAPTDPLRPDTDNDDLMDGAETDTGVYVSPDDAGTDPLVADSDGDTYPDGEEVFKGSDPNVDTSLPPASTEPLVVLDATSLPEGPLAVWPNQGTWNQAGFGGDFVAGGRVPEVTTVAGVPSVAFNYAGTADYYNGPASPAWICGDGPRTIEAWVHNPDINGDEETVFAWGRRGGGDGTNMSFGHGQNATWGAVGHWGAQDIGWQGDMKANEWTYIVYAYDPTIGALPGTGSLYKDGTNVIADDTVGVIDTWAADNTGERLPMRVASQNNADGTPTAALRAERMNIARIRIHDRALDASTIAATYEAERDEFGLVDYDNDGLPTWYERGYTFLDENNAADAALDEDQDNLTNLTEYQLGTMPDNADSDSDLASDGQEVNVAQTNPLLPDTDQDGLLDGVETDTGNFVSATDTGSDPLIADSDGDTYLDGQEVARGSDPNVASSVPNLTAPLAIIDLDASGLASGPLATWPNSGAMGGAFVAGPAVAEVSRVAGANGVTLDGESQYYTGPVSPLFLTGNPSMTVDAWIYNAVVEDEETLLSWGRRGGNPDGSNMAFGHGLNAAYGAAGHWGAPDIGWNDTTVEAQWTYVAYSYDPSVPTAGTGTGTLYTDGVQANQEANGPLAIHAVDSTAEALPLLIRLGAQNSGTGGVDLGQAGAFTISRVRVYDTTLSAADIQNIYTAELPGYQGGNEAEIDSVVRVGNQVTFTWTGPAGGSYTVEASSDAASGYGSVATGLTETTYTADIVAGENRFFRVITE